MSIVLRKVDKAYGEKAVLRDFSLTLPESGVVALMGPSGCGKTTLLRLLAGLERPDQGEIHMPNHPVVSMVFQEDRLLDSLTVLGNLLAVLRGDHREKRAMDCLEGCEMEREAHRYPGELSGGMRRRVAVARAVAYGGHLLLMDEPFKGLDLDLKRRVMQFVMGERKKAPGLTLLVTHDREEADRGDQVISFAGPPLHRV